MKKPQPTIKRLKNNSFLVFLAKYHSLLFFVVLSAGIFVALFMLVGVLNASNLGSGGTDAQVVNTSFDEATIKRLKELSEGGGGSSAPPGGRINPFVE